MRPCWPRSSLEERRRDRLTPQDLDALDEAERLRQQKWTIRTAAHDAPPGFRGDRHDLGCR
jgi:hypothetical protein